MPRSPGPLRRSQWPEREGARGRTHRCFRMTFCDSSEYDFRSRSIAWYFLSMSFTPARTRSHSEPETPAREKTTVARGSLLQAARRDRA
eukprot:COSAG04_NODE_2_length_56781_cov_25.092252_10_plen_89_part_00